MPTRPIKLPIVYHIIIANSTTSIPIILVTTTTTTTATKNSTKAELLFESVTSSLSLTNNSTIDNQFYNNTVDVEDVNNDKSIDNDDDYFGHSTEMIVLHPKTLQQQQQHLQHLQLSNNQSNNNNTNDDSTIQFSSDFLKLIETIYMKANVNDDDHQEKISNENVNHNQSDINWNLIHNLRSNIADELPDFDHQSSPMESFDIYDDDDDDDDDDNNNNDDDQQIKTTKPYGHKIQKLSLTLTTTTTDPMISSYYDNDYESQSSIINDQQSTNYIDNDHSIRNIIVIICYSLIIIFSLCGNYLVCHVIYSTPKLRTTTNILIFSLAISDILTTVLNIPFNCARFLLLDWPFPDSFCMIMPTLQVTSVYVSALTMAAICLHRYRSILGTTGPNIVISSRVGFNHITHSMSRIRIKICILFIWIISILLALPHTIFNVVVWTELSNGQMIRRCRAEYPHSIKEQMPLILSLLATFTQFLLPLGMTTILYCRIGRIIAHQGKLAKHYCDELNRRVVEAKRKRITMLVLIIVGFLITWLPITMYHLIIDFHLVHFHWNLFLALHIWAMTSVCYNSFIYCFMNEDFRKRSKQIIARHQRIFLTLCFFLFTNRKFERNIGTSTPSTGSVSATMTLPAKCIMKKNFSIKSNDKHDNNNNINHHNKQRISLL
ncbi:neuropeptide Y receptor [Dermatophagoides pteronyssinus]|uniref:Neuropeptide Y receptor n=1 Tax=Dermatophagoides pteronyssinus TaxID=6956 RepID=A0ABQ8J848_DERPT|nr:neuropeptide Y receptor [Dermatophagoides pteronyssinus]